jgi:transcriptional regulator with XRE-family HTH domain
MPKSSVTLDRVRRHVNALLKEQGARQLELAEYLGMSTGWLNMFLKGKRPVGWPVVDRMAEFFKIPLSALFADPDAEEVHSLPLTKPERKGSHVVASSVASHRGELPEDRIRAQQALIATQQTSIPRYHNRLEAEQAERERFQQMLELAENHLASLIETLQNFNKAGATSGGDAAARAIPPRGLHAPRSIRR